MDGQLFTIIAADGGVTDNGADVVTDSATLTIRLPDEKHARLKLLAQHLQISVNKLIEELSTVALAQFDAELRFRARAARGSVEEGLRLLDMLDADPGS